MSCGIVWLRVRTRSRACSSVRIGWSCVPGFASLPFGATKMFHGLGGPASKGGADASIDASTSDPPVPDPPAPAPPAFDPPAPVAAGLEPADPTEPATPELDVDAPDPDCEPASFDWEHATIAHATVTTPTRLLMETSPETPRRVRLFPV